MNLLTVKFVVETILDVWETLFFDKENTTKK